MTPSLITGFGSALTDDNSFGGTVTQSLIVAVVSLVIGAYGVILRRWWKMQDNSTEAYRDGANYAESKYLTQITALEAKHSAQIEELESRHSKQIQELSERHSREIRELRTSLVIMQQGFADLIPLVEEQHRPTAIEILIRISRPISDTLGWDAVTEKP